MKLPCKKCNAVVILALLCLFIFILQLMQHQRVNKRHPLTSSELRSSDHDSDIASDCLKDLKNPKARELFQEAVSQDINYMLSVLMEYLPHCAKHPPRKFIGHFMQLVTNTLEAVDAESFEFESPWPNRTHNSNQTIDNICPELPPLLQGNISILFNGKCSIIIFM